LLAFTLFFPCLFLLAISFSSSFLFNVALVSRLLNIVNCLPSDVLCFAFQEDLKWVSHALDLYLLMHWTWSPCIFWFSFLGVDCSTQSFPAADFFKVLITEKTLKGRLALHLLRAWRTCNSQPWKRNHKILLL
jgi:hypothetical protein